MAMENDPAAQTAHMEAGDSYCYQSMEWIELKRSSPIQIHEPLILIQSNPVDGPESESSPVQSRHNRVSIYQMPSKIDM